MRPIDRKPGKRGPYRVEGASADRDAELLRDPEVAAFAAAFREISDPKKRACVEWLVRELARETKGGA
jgi:hypothetical protein